MESLDNLSNIFHSFPIILFFKKKLFLKRKKNAKDIKRPKPPSKNDSFDCIMTPLIIAIAEMTRMSINLSENTVPVIMEGETLSLK